MKKYWTIFFTTVLGFFSCQQKSNFESEKQNQIEANQKVINVLRDGGDKLIISRNVFHWVYFKSETQKDNYLKEVTTKGFELVSSNKVDDKFPFQIQIKRIDKVDKESVDEYVIYLWEKAREFSGEYDGWETSIEK